MKRQETSGLHVVDAGPVRLLAIHQVRHVVERAVRPHGVEVPGYQHRLTFARRARDQVIAIAVAARDAGQGGAGEGEFDLGQVHQPVDSGGVRGGRFQCDPLGEFGQKVLGASHVGLRHRLVLVGWDGRVCASDGLDCPRSWADAKRQVSPKPQATHARAMRR
jgi:hypothetical protein